MKKRIAIWILCIFLLISYAGCTPSGDKPGQATPEEPDFEKAPEVQIVNEIQYELTRNLQRQGENVSLFIPHANGGKTGGEVIAQIKMEKATEDFNYYVIDWGDGTWSYDGPYAAEKNYLPTAEVPHVYKKAGEYQVKACAMNLKAGTINGWTDVKTVKVSGDDYRPEMITTVTPIESSSAGEEYGCANIADGDNTTRWKSALSDSPETQEFVGYLFDGYYTLDAIEIKFPADSEIFPSDISIEYTTDGGFVWYMMPRYYYVLPNSEGYYSCVMNFPDPMGATLSLPLRQIAANGIRIKSVCYPSYSTSGNYFSVEEMRVYGKKGTFFYTSYDGYYDADLSNMWAIFGTAKTEPRVYNSVGNGGQNPWEFRAGGTMTASIEWTAWNGAKLNWSGYTEALKIHEDSLKKAVYGGDGWYYDEAKGKYVVDTGEYKSNPHNDGFIWATSGAPQHLDAQNHYTNNSALIIASRDFLLTGNDTDGFLQSTNAKKQIMLDKLRKAMEYMLVNLNGESGLMTIYDPRNDGTVYGMASNYWDSLNFFGYNSAYENVMFYQAVLAMADIENFIGNSAEVNFMAVSAGLASKEQAQKIYDWVDGKRIIDSDTSKGADIYTFKVSARSNTLALDGVVVDGLHYWWYNGHSFNDIKPGHWGEYGYGMQNGGTIFYTSFYDIMGRTLISGDRAIERFNKIMSEFHIDSLRRAPRPIPGNFYQVSIVGEFPESGLVPLSFLTGIIGVNPDVKGLKIESNLPSDMEFAGVSEYNYMERKYDIEVNKAITAPEMTQKDGKFVVKVPASGTFYITKDNKIMANGN